MGSLKTHSPSKMGWLTACLVGMLLASAKSMPLEEEVEVADQDEVREIFTRLFVEGREGRDLEMEIDNEIEDEEEGESKAIEGAIQETNTQEISRFNNYIDAIYKRMNAALRAKLMDPMVLNLQGKDKKKEGAEKDAKWRIKVIQLSCESKELLAPPGCLTKKKWKWRWKLLRNWSTGWANQKPSREIKTKKRRKGGKRPKRTRQRM